MDAHAHTLSLWTHPKDWAGISSWNLWSCCRHLVVDRNVSFHWMHIFGNPEINPEINLSIRTWVLMGWGYHSPSNYPTTGWFARKSTLRGTLLGEFEVNVVLFSGHDLSMTSGLHEEVDFDGHVLNTLFVSTHDFSTASEQRDGAIDTLHINSTSQWAHACPASKCSRGIYKVCTNFFSWRFVLIYLSYILIKQ